MLSGAKNITGMPAFFGGGPEPVGAAAGEQRRLLAHEGQADADHAGLLHPVRQQPCGRRILHRQPAHDGKAFRIALRGLEAVVVAIARPRRRHDHGAVDAGLVHQGDELLDGEGLGQLGLAPRHPLPVGRFGFP
jgi:hypothetical protein